MNFLAPLSLLLFVSSLSIFAAEKKESPYELMVCDYVKFDLSRVNKAGEVTWTHKPISHVWDFVLTNDNHLIFPVITKLYEVRCMDMQKNIKWSWKYRKEYQEIINITQTNSQIIISGQKPSEAIFMDTNGKIQRKIDIPTNFHSKHGELGNIYALENGNFLVQLWGEGSVIEVDKDGKELWRYQVPNNVKSKHNYPVGCVQDVLRLKNGNTMIACGTQARILEVTPDKEIVWKFKTEDHPELNLTNACGLQLLKDGSIFVTNFIRGKTGKGAHAFILSKKDKKVIWTFNDHKNFKAASRIYAIEE
jgi:outer membrane protein assembly factor BamB